MATQLTRRAALFTAGAALTIVAVPTSGLADTEARALVMEFTGGVEPQPGRVTLDLPEIAENGNAVPLHVQVDSPMTADDHVARVLILADDNPRPMVARFDLSPLSGQADVSTRIRLGDSQTVTAVAAMSDGSYHMAARSVVVTVGGCTG